MTASRREYGLVFGKGMTKQSRWCGHCKSRSSSHVHSRQSLTVQLHLCTSSLQMRSRKCARLIRHIAVAEKQDKVVIAKTDADGVGRDLGSRYGVTGFPSTSDASADRIGRADGTALKWFPAGSTDPVDYQGARDLDALAGL